MNKTLKWLLVIVAILVVSLLSFYLFKPSEKVSQLGPPAGRSMDPGGREQGPGGRNQAPGGRSQGLRDRTPSKVDAFVVSPSLLNNEISVSGTLLANDEVELKSEVSGRVVAINLPEGKLVKKGTLLVKIFDDDLQADLKKLQIQLEIQEKIHARQEELLKVNGISQNDYELTELQLNSLRANIEVQKVQIRKTELLAPFDGVIGLRNISVGAQITTGTMLATIRTESKLKLDFNIPEKYSANIKSGMKISFSMSNTDEIFEATVFATEQGIDETTRNLKVRAMVNSKSPSLIPGAFTDVKLQLGSKNDALMIPTLAIIPTEKTKKVIVARGGKAHFAEVRTGVRKASIIEITDGLQVGDTIITTGILFLKEGSKLSYSSVKSDSL